MPLSLRVGGLYGRGGAQLLSTMVSRLTGSGAAHRSHAAGLADLGSALARQLVALCEHGEYGLYHATCQVRRPGTALPSLLCHVANELGRPLPMRFGASIPPPLPTAAPRPAMSVLDLPACDSRPINDALLLG